MGLDKFSELRTGLNYFLFHVVQTKLPLLPLTSA